jgi:hypothetical protein
MADNHRNRFPLLDRELLLFAPIYFILSYANLAVKLWQTPAWFSLLERNHQLLLLFQYTNNEQSRLGQFYVPEFFHQLLGLSIIHSYMLNRFLFLFLAFVVFHRYLRKWFSSAESFAGVLFLAAILPFTYMNCLQESAPQLFFLFLLALVAIRDERPIMLAVVLFLGGMVNETMFILPAVYFFYHLRWGSITGMAKTAGKSLLAGVPIMLTLFPIRWINRDRPHLGGGWHWPDNWQGIARDAGRVFESPQDAFYWYFILMYGVFWIYAVMGYRRSPLFLQRASWMIPLFVFSHLITGIIKESRQMVPLAYIIIPMALFFLFGKKETGTTDRPDA